MPFDKILSRGYASATHAPAIYFDCIFLAICGAIMDNVRWDDREAVFLALSPTAYIT